MVIAPELPTVEDVAELLHSAVALKVLNMLIYTCKLELCLPRLSCDALQSPL